MNIVIWILAGGGVGWMACSFMGFNQQRGAIMAAIIGAAGGLTGGKLVAPMFAAPGDPAAMAVVFAVGIAAVFIAAGHFMHDKFDI